MAIESEIEKEKMTKSARRHTYAVEDLLVL
jgi:hypothetical protein